MITKTYRKSERMKTEQRDLFLLIVLSVVFIFSVSALARAADVDDNGRKVIKSSRSEAKVVIEKTELTTRPNNESRNIRKSFAVRPSNADEFEPTKLSLNFPTLVYPGEEVRGKLKYNDPDDYVVSIFITVFFPDGDVVTDSLYDVRIDGGDVYKGTITFWVEMPDSETPLPGKIIITCTDDYLNVSEVSTTFVQPF